MRVLLLTLVSLISATTCNASVSVHASSLHQSLVAPIAIGIKRATRLGRNNASAASNDFAVRRQHVRVRGGSAAVSDKKPPPIKLLRWVSPLPLAFLMCSMVYLKCTIT